MLRIDNDNLRDEISSAREWREKHLRHWRGMKERFAGLGYRSDASYDYEYDIENIIGQYVSLVLPRVAYDVPRVHVTADDPENNKRAQALELAMNQWCKRSATRPTLQQIATDMCMTWGVGLVTPEPVKHLRRIDMGGAGLMPRIYRIAPEKFFIDPAAETAREARYFGHEYKMDLDDLLVQAESDSAFDLEVVRDVKASYDRKNEEYARASISVPDRNEVTIIEMWIPELEVEGAKEGEHHGGLVRLIEDTEGSCQLAGEPKPYYGPACGPYTVFGAYSVPSDVYPLGPMTMALPLIEETNDHAKTMSYSAAAYRRLVLVDSRGTKMAQDVASTPDMFVVPAENMDRDRVIPLEIGGVTEQQMAYQNIMAARIDRLTGMSEVIRGSVTGDATATEVSTASASSSLRLGYIQRQFADAVNSLMYKAAWYIINDDTEVPLGPKAAAFKLPPKAKGRDMGIDLTEMTLDVQAYSMERTSEALQQRRAVELMQIVGNVGQQVAAMPFINWERLMAIVGDALNVPDMGDILNAKELKKAIEQAQQAQQAQMQEQEAQAASQQAAARSRMQTGPADASQELRNQERSARGRGGF